MGIFDFFKPVNSITPDEVRGYIREKSTDEYCLLDVRQPAEYAAGHLPGAKLIPLGELRSRIGEMNPEKPTIVYCRTASRSRSAAGLLTGAGFKEVYNMQGGIIVYNGAIASGVPESGMFCFQESSVPTELAAVAWLIEDGSMRFLAGLGDMIQGTEVSDLVGKLTQAKAEKKTAVLNLYEQLAGRKPDKEFPAGVLEAPPEDIMAGCVKVGQALQWAKGKETRDILEAMMALEANTLDLYLKMERITREEEAKKVFRLLSEQENTSLGIVASLLDKTL